MIFYSQQGEDVFVYNHFMNMARKDGVFVELGGMDGVTYSNSKFFEDELGYTGVLIEPTTQFQSMQHYRPNCKNFNVAVGLENAIVKIMGTYATAGLVETMHEDFQKRHHPTSESYDVQARPFRDILKEADVEYIDFLSIDVEGGELLVLQSMDFSIPVYVIVIEMDGYNRMKDEACREILRSNGFSFKRRFANNEFWVKEDYARRSFLFDASIPKVKSLENEGHLFPCLENGVRQEVGAILEQKMVQ